MQDNQRLTIDSSSIIPLVDNNQTQIIFQRHCNYDRSNGGLIPESIDYQINVINSFINVIKNYSSVYDIQNTYFLFTSSGTISNGDFKRCVDTTNIAMNLIKKFLKENNIPLNHIMNLNENSNYNYNIHESRHLTEPKMFTDSTGYLEFLKEKHGGINKDFWIDFEEDLSKEKREQFNSEGPDQIVHRGVRYINVLQRYANYFHAKHPNSRLIIWSGTHYDLISPLVKQRILNYEKSDVVNVDYCGGISLVINESNDIIANINGITYPFDSQYSKQHHRHF